ncbi:MAG: S1 RNA-binding domain-containing protein [Roseiflexus sp.]|nr:S1 RNA-binding domain-containing protein [Roseiflexus sp.]MCS7288170.1 S1 RNA-binding domain-containing protein [Roseiflexus sp.]MDW8145978.1 S1 RNA-binding domain-containing protein [Roseiflexaceae bacterium]MDW8232993.1 S1 RNA-binding domain-containing protein [Roseiflexaceae bacterium]
MTDQERPVEERNELLGNLAPAPQGVAVAEAEIQQQSIESPPAAEALSGAEAGAMVEASGAVASSNGENGAKPAHTTDEAAVAAVGATADAPTPAAHALPADSAGSAPEAQTPAAETPPAGTAEAASYQAPAGEPAGRPRRVKDLTPGMELEGRVTSIALYGIFVDIGVGRDGLVHISEMSDTRIESPSDLVKIGDTVKVRVKSVEPDGRRISLTMRTKDRSAEPRGSRGKKKPEVDYEKLAALRVGDNVEGTVTGLAPFGVFVDIGVGKDGLVHVSELAEGRVEKVEDVVQVGQTYTFKILEVDAEGARISLSLRRAQRMQKLQQLEKGQILEGTVSGLAPFGAFVDIGVGRDGLVHISELSNTRVARVEDAVKVGDKVQVRVLNVDPQSKRISLSMRLEDTPREPPREERVREERPRGERVRGEGRASREERLSRRERLSDAYASADDDDFSGNATLEDLMSKFGGPRRSERRRRQEDDDDDLEDRNLRRQREAIRRTLRQLDDD